MHEIVIFALVVFTLATTALAIPLSNVFRNHYGEQAVADLSGLSAAAFRGHLLHFTLEQTVLVPALTNPPRLPECPKPRNVSDLLEKSINTTYGAMITGDFTVETAFVQGVPSAQHCKYSSAVFYSGDPALKRYLVAAANVGADKICKALPQYCKEAFAKDSGYRLDSCSGNAKPGLPPVLDFQCTKRQFSQKLDHFEASEPRGFQQKYWVCDAAWPKQRQQQRHTGNIIVFLGNESPLGTPAQPIVFEHARRMNALVVEVEHRYYGESQPFPVGADGMLNSTALYKWLAVEQVIEDTVAVLEAVRKQYAVPAAVPAIVIGGSYGGMLATYHRVAKPDVFAAAIAASAPVTFMFSTDEWLRTSNRYHKIVAAAVDANSQLAGKHTTCRKAVRRGFEMIELLGQTAEGRRQLARLFQLCGDPAAVLPDARAVFALEMEQYDWYEGFVQVNNQPSLMGQMALVCNVINNVLARGNSELEALAAVTTYFAHNGSASWCYDFNATFYLTDRSAYAYQGCSQGFPNTAMLPAKGSKHSLIPAFEVQFDEYAAQCRGAFGADVPGLKVPSIAAGVQHLLREVGGVVFTNGELDGWAGGSYLSTNEIWGPTVTAVAPAAAFTSTDIVDFAGVAAKAAAGGGELSSSRGGRKHEGEDFMLGIAAGPHGPTTTVATAAEETAAGVMAAAQQSATAPAAAAVNDGFEIRHLVTNADVTAMGLDALHEFRQEFRRQQQQQQWLQRRSLQAVPQHQDGFMKEGMLMADAASSVQSSGAPVAFVIYEGASHCTDTHNRPWNLPERQPKEWKRQRARAMTFAAQFADMHRIRTAVAITS